MEEKTSMKLQIQRKPGRPKQSDKSANELTAARMQKLRQRRKAKDLVPLDIWIPKTLRKALHTVLERDEDLSCAAAKAFQLLIMERRKSR
jgi:hypothetical protein